MKLQKIAVWIALLSAILIATASGARQNARAGSHMVSSSGKGDGHIAAVPADPAAPADYVIGPDDVLMVNVWKEPELSRSVLVRPDGKITLPLLRDIDAGGSTPTQLQDRIQQALADYVSKPAVTVIVQEAKSHKFNILGAVQKPGSYIITGPMTVLDAIALAGGLREWAKTGGIYILREASPGAREKIPFPYKKVVKGLGPDVLLKIRDTIIVP